MTPEQILDEAVHVIERDGWHQGRLTSGNASTGPVCALGAITRAATGNAFNYTGEADAAANRLGAHIVEACSIEDSSWWQNIPAWNDDPARTKEDVILALKQAAHGEV
ncbi:hypothetical protein OV450_3399 [Actinobacteria bacterium OV450]|nr:hypothetical protein OV450_3399 [Actinobacteria bacterium OV450]